jgi:Zn-dependent peptidase ImmA (M78 family)
MLTAVAGLDANRGAKRAREARSGLGLDPAAPLACLLDVVEDRARLPVVVATLQDGLAGACVPFGEGRLLFLNGTQPAVRQRFTLAHELGHAWCRHEGGLAVDTFATLSGKASTPLEIQANAFAAEFLIPRVALDELLDGDPSLDQLMIVAAHYGTSALMTLFRFKQAGLVSSTACAVLEDDIGEGRHHEAFARLGLTGPADRLGAMDELPYLSPALRDTQLGAVLQGRAAADPGLATAIERLLA